MDLDLSTNDKKRRHLDEDGCSEEGSRRQQTILEEIQRDEDVWLSDGNIVIIAQDVAFRVHKSVLALHSEVFRDLFLVSTPASNPGSLAGPTETVDGCAVIKVSDNPNDLRRLFLVLSCGKNYYYRDDLRQTVPFDVLDSLIRMGHKYCIRSVLCNALSRLQKYYSNDLSTWLDDARRAQYVAAPEPQSAIQTINLLATLTNTLSLLPAAFLTCCSHIESVITDTPDGPDSPSLSTEDVLRVINGRAALTRAAVDRIVGMTTTGPSKQCNGDYRCAHAGLSALAAHKGKSTLEEMQKHTMAFAPLYERFWKLNSQKIDPLCDQCRTATKQQDAERCRESWLQLPAMLDIEVPGWPARSEFPI